jgi:hypothetical protein
MMYPYGAVIEAARRAMFLNYGQIMTRALGDA